MIIVFLMFFITCSMKGTVIALVAMHILFCSCLCTVRLRVLDSHALGILSRYLLAMHIVLFLSMQSSLTSF